jgi:hypothetical protein
MPLYTELSSAGLIVATNAIVSISARIKLKNSTLGKRRATEIILIAIQKFLSEVTELSEQIVDHVVSVDKITFY